MADGRTKHDVWVALEAHHDAIGSAHLRTLFAKDPGRAARFTRRAAGLTLDFSKHRIDEQTLALLAELAAVSGLDERRAALFSGGIVNETEGRPALHTALRNQGGSAVLVDGEDVMPAVDAVLARMRSFVESVHDASRCGYSGKAFTDVVNIGIGGSDLGPHMAATALEAWRPGDLRAHFVSNVDALHIDEALRGLDPGRTLFVIASKTFSTQETLANAQTARRWLLDASEDEAAVTKHFVAVSAHVERVAAFGIDPENMFPFWDWVGGRYSLWSAIGLSVALAVGMDGFERLLDGAHAMDLHFRSARPTDNLPVLLAMLGVWYGEFFGIPTHAVLPYDWALRLLPAHLQQLEMESNGKRVTRDGQAVEHLTSPVVWGGPGNNGQHAFYQLMHQGTRIVPADVIVGLRSQATLGDHQAMVLANAFGQTQALMCGRTEDEARSELEAQGLDEDSVARLVPHLVMPGNRPSSTILYDRLTPEVLGALVALYEHKVFVQSLVWDVNPFDQWGVELGKQLAGRLLRELASPHTSDDLDSSTAALVDYAKRARPG